MTFQTFDVAKLCDPAHIWWINPEAAANNTLLIQLAPFGNAPLQSTRIQVDSIKKDPKYWFPDTKYQKAKWLFYLSGSKLSDRSGPLSSMSLKHKN